MADPDLGARLAALSPEQRLLLEARIRGSGGAGRIPRLPDGVARPLSPAQERLWFLQQWDTESGAYNRASAFRLKGLLRLDTLQRSLDAIVQRHDVLRAGYSAADGMPATVLRSGEQVPLTVIDAASDTIDAALRREAIRPFNLEHDCLLRAAVFRLSDTQHVLLLVTHHIAADRWSDAVLYDELERLYAADGDADRASLPVLSIQYGDFAAWQLGRIAASHMADDERYWASAIGDAPTVLSLPADYTGATNQDSAGSTYRFAVDVDLTQRLRAAASAEGATLFAALLAAFAALVRRWAGAADFLVGVPFAGRSQLETERLIGCFVNTLPLRCRVPRGATLRDVLRGLKQATRDAHAHAELPFERIIDLAAPDRAATHAPLVQVMFALQNTPERPLRLDGLDVQPIVIDTGVAKFALTFEAVEGPDGLSCAIEYGTRVFKRRTIERLARQWMTLLRAVAMTPDAAVESITLLSASDAALLEAWNATDRAFEAYVCIPQLVRRAAARARNYAAILTADETITYRDLMTQVSGLARALREEGVQRGSLVGICMQRSPRMIVALLAVLEAGGAYVPLDPEYPKARTAALVEQARPDLILSDNGAIAGAARTRVVDVATLAVSSATRPPDPIEATADDLAYVLFTSGSTGTPKGVMMPHRAVCNHLAWMQEAHAIRRTDRWLHHTSITFDVSVGEIFGTLAAGATLVLAPPGAQRDPAQLARLIDAHRITVIDVVPRMLKALMDEPAFERCRTLRQVHCGAETLPPDVAREFLSRSTATLLNFYGPTETCIDVAVWKCSLVDADETVPIGRPIANVRLHVLDDDGRQVPVGQAGEIHVGGACLAKGYLGSPALTNAAFVANPIDPAHSPLLYRTGDLGRYRDDGALEFLGRRDRQVKVRGMRVELEEIEAAIRRLPDVGDVIVVLSRETSEPRVVAYVETRSRDTRSLRDALAQIVPAHMVPAAFVPLPALPRTAGGKIDAAALPGSEAAVVPADEMPRGALETAVARLFQEVLGTRPIGRHHNFFEHGGHSLLAARVMARLRDATRLDLPLPLIFESPTPAALAQAIAARGAQQDEDTRFARTRIAPRSGVARPRASFSQERLWLLEALEGATGAYNLPVALRLRGPLAIPALRTALDALPARHESLRTTFLQEDGVVWQQIAAQQALPLAVMDVRHVPDATRERTALALASDEAKRPFDLVQGPLVRASLYALGDEDHLFLLVLHHIVADGWSVDVLLRDLEALYHAGLEGGRAALEPLPLQFADVAAWQREAARTSAEDHLGYWERRLAGAPPLLDLPADRPRPAAQSFAGARVPITLSGDAVSALRRIAHEQGATLFMSLLASFHGTLARYVRGSAKDIVVGTPCAGRTTADVEAIVGLFVNTLPIRIDCSDDPTFRELLARARDAAIGAYAHESLPFEQLITRLNPPRHLSYSPLFQVMFILESEGADEALGLPGISTERVSLDTGTAKYDLTLSFRGARDGLAGYLEYATALFDRATAERFAAHFEQLLRGAIAQPESRLSELPLLTEAERRSLADWNATSMPVLVTCVHEAIEAQVNRTPDAVAVTFAGRSLTYRELDDRANRLADRLRALDAGPHTLVAVHVRRSEALVVCLLAVLKAGGAYVPLDPAYPAERLAFVVADSGARVVLSDAPESLPPLDTAIVHVADEAPQSGPERTLGGARPRDLAYVIYTSGSTGTPKGVAIEHRNVANFFAGMDALLGRRAGVWLAVTSVSFDISVLELLWTLARGFQVVIRAGDDSRFDETNSLAALIRTHGVTHLQCTPSLLQAALLEPRAAAALGELECLLLGGEPLPEALLAALEPHRPRRVLNMYGPTETTIWSTAAELKPGARITIGRPLANTGVHILDEHGRDVPAGVPGELHISGDGVAREYLGRPDLTRERFVFASDGRRMYRTGDLARHLADGSIEFIGRVDQQVKLRGHRIEPGEIETALCEHPEIRRAAVAVRRDDGIDPRLVAYVVPNTPGARPGGLREYLQQRLPIYMVPAVYEILEQLPLTPNGKVDRRALPAPATGTAARDAATTPRTSVEDAVAAIWADVLGLGPSSDMPLDGDFFQLGGHSLAAARVMSRIRDAFSIDLPLRTLFEAPTARALAAAIQQAGGPNDAAPAEIVSAIHADGRLPPFFFLHAAMEGEAFYSRHLARCLGPDQPFYSLAPLGLDGTPLPETIERIAAHYVRIIRQQQPRGPYRVGGFCVSGPVVLEIANQLLSARDEVALVVLVDSWIENLTIRSRVARRAVGALASWLGRPDAWVVETYLRLREIAGWNVPRPPTNATLLPVAVRTQYIRAAMAYAPRRCRLPLVHLRTADRWHVPWARLTRTFVEHTIPGDHDTCVTEHLGTLAAALAEHLERSRSTTSPTLPGIPGIGEHAAGHTVTTETAHG